jgi:hypothetical protein
MSHFYTKDGQPCHFQENGKPTTLREARKDDLRPSVTDILGIMDKPGLSRYFQNQLLDAAWDDNTYKDVEELDWKAAVRKQAKVHSESARDAGIAVHNALEKAYLGKEVPDEHLTTVDAVTTAIFQVYGKGDDFNAEPEVTFASDTFGGTVDLVCPGAIIDFKRKADGWELKKDGTPKKMWYLESHAAQLAAYRSGLGLHDHKCANVFIGPNDEVYIHEWSEEDLARGLSIFMASLALWKAVKAF